MLVGHYIEELGGSLSYYDLNTGDDVFPIADVYVIGYWEDWVDQIKWPNGCVVIDPWRHLTISNKNVKIIHYGNTRK
jgi:hypothetical protein